jgi:hypothetical protein
MLRRQTRGFTKFTADVKRSYRWALLVKDFSFTNMF